MNEKKIYNGQYKIKFVKSNHAYYIAKKEKDGWGKWERKTGSTTWIGIKDKSTPLKYWVAKIMAKFLNNILSERSITTYDIDEAKKLHCKRLEQAATIGSKIHDWIEAYIKNKNPDMPEENNVLLGVNAFLEWVKKYKVKFLESEMFLYSRKYDYCGTSDAVAIINNKRVLIDYKTSPGLYNDVMLQTASYVQIYEEMGCGKIAGRWAIRLEKRTEKEFKNDMDEKGNVNVDYAPFEAIYLGNSGDTQKKDFQAFLAAKHLKEWDKESTQKLEEFKNKPPF